LRSRRGNVSTQDERQPARRLRPPRANAIDLAGRRASTRSPVVDEAGRAIRWSSRSPKKRRANVWFTMITHLEFSVIVIVELAALPNGDAQHAEIPRRHNLATGPGSYWSRSEMSGSTRAACRAGAHDASTVINSKSVGWQ